MFRSPALLRAVRSVRARGLVLALALAVAPQPARAADDAVAEDIVSYFLAPRTEELALAAERQREAWTAFCAAPTAAGTAGLKQAFRETVEAWAAIELVRFGPMGEAARHERMNFFPERRNATGRAVSALLAGTDEVEAAVARGSVAGQGLGALERILYDAGAETLADAKAPEARRCAVGRAIAGRIAVTAREASEGWVNGPARAGLSPRDFLVRALTDTVASYRDLAENRIKPVIGDAPQTAKPEAAIFRRSGLTERVLLLDVAAARTLAGLIAADDPAARAVLHHAAAAEETAERLSGPLGRLAADPKRRHEAQRLFAAVRDAHNRLGEDLPLALGIPIGFNSLDGD